MIILCNHDDCEGSRWGYDPRRTEGLHYPNSESIDARKLSRARISSGILSVVHGGRERSSHGGQEPRLSYFSLFAVYDGRGPTVLILENY